MRERPRNAYYDNIKLREILKLREEFQAEPVLYYVLTNELTNEHNAIYADRPQLQKNYLHIFKKHHRLLILLVLVIKKFN